MTTPPTAATLTTVLLKKHGLRNTAIRGMRPNDPANCRFTGPALTLRYLPIREDLAAQQDLASPEALIHAVMRRVRPGDVVVIDAMGREDAGILGDVLATRLKVLGAAGVVCDGAMRDVVGIREAGLPMFCRNATPPPSFVQLMLADVGIPVACGGVTVFPGDIVVADEDGVTVCPAGMAEAAIAATSEQDRVERYIRLRVEAGEPLLGLYPPNERVVADFRAWIAAGEPPIRGQAATRTGSHPT
jgi:regulator of RNase E activity RraA